MKTSILCRHEKDGQNCGLPIVEYENRKLKIINRHHGQTHVNYVELDEIFEIIYVGMEALHAERVEPQVLIY